MRPIRAFLFARGANDKWGCQVFRDFEPLLEATIAANGGRQFPVGVHVGFERPDTEAVEELLSKQEGLVFLSSGAMGTMPLPVRASHASIGSVGENSFYAALDGFGYQVEQADEKPSASLQPPLNMPIHESTGPRGWMAILSKLEPALAENLYIAGIWDEDSYLLREGDLDMDLRYLSGLRRYEILEGKQPDASSLVDHLRSAPPWLLGAPIALLNLSVRSNNVCAAHEIKTIGDFTKYGLKGLYRLPNLGRKSVNEISREMAHLFTTGHPLKLITPKLEWLIPEQLAGIPVESKEDSVESDSNNGSSPKHISNLSLNITSGFIEAAETFEQSERRVWAGRLGLRCEPMTFQQIADQIGVSRERVRQIEIKLYRKIHRHPFWEELSRRVQEHLYGRTSPLFLAGLSAIDPWFEGADQLVHALREVSDHIPSLGFHILTWNDLSVISSISQAEWIKAIDKAQNILVAIAEQNLSEQDALSQALGVLTGKGEDLREALQEEISKFCIWSSASHGSRILTGFGRSSSDLVLAVLQASAMPLHIDKIENQIRTHTIYKEINASSIRRAASEVGLLFGRGTYGLLKHCPLDPSQMLAVRAEIEDIVSGGLPSKQWHSSELYDELLNRGFSYEGKLTKYIINIALANSNCLVYLRRMIWGIRSKWNDNADARLDVKQAIVSLLEEEGKPMSTEQIRSRLIEGRGLNTTFQIWASSPLVRLGPGLWGLEGRDLDMQHAQAMAYRLLKELSVRQEGMHVSEVVTFLGVGSEDEVTMLSSVANKDGLRIDRGQYYYLQPWGNSRRISIGEAASSILKSHPDGLLRGELQLLVDRIAKRKVDSQHLSSILQDIDAVYNPESRVWKLALLTDEESENDVGYVDLSPGS